MTDKITKKTLEAFQEAQNMANDLGCAELLPEHLFYALINDENGLIPSIFAKMNVETDGLKIALKNYINSMPRVSGNGKTYASQQTEKVLAAAEKEMKKNGDEYLSVEHIAYAIISAPGDKLKELFNNPL